MSVDPVALVEAMLEHLERSYVFPDRTERAKQLLRAQVESGAYNSASGPDLCDRINGNLLEASNDKHLRLIWHDSPVEKDDPEGLIAEMRELFRIEAGGVREVKRLAGNVGLIALTIVPDAASAGPAIGAAMELVRHTSALILDLRDCRGGTPDGVTLWSSHFVADGEVRLSDVVEGPRGPARQFWTYPYVPGPRYVGRPLQILTSSTTFSGGESLAYDLQAVGRATVVGEVTRGGAHPSTMVPLHEHIELRLPVARTLSPITGSNWEGVGVQPDVPAARAEALDTAHQALLRQLEADKQASPAMRAEASSALAAYG
jgi:C-terminal processing protease CtpA/Prc